VTAVNNASVIVKVGFYNLSNPSQLYSVAENFNESLPSTAVDFAEVMFAQGDAVQNLLTMEGKGKHAGG